MNIKPGFVIRDVAGQAVAVAVGEASKSFRGMIKLNATGAVVWRGIAEGLDQNQIADRIAEKFGAEREEALADVEGFIARLRDLGIVEG